MVLQSPSKPKTSVRFRLPAPTGCKMYKKFRQWLYQTDGIELALFAAIWGSFGWAAWQVVIAIIEKFF